MASGGIRLKLYRQFHRGLIQKKVLPCFFSADRMRVGTATSRAEILQSADRIWFHAASVGELESLWTVIAGWLELGKEAVITVFSESARSQLLKLEQELAGKPGRIVYVGYSPWEGNWKESLEDYRPVAFITAKYEAWPELWASLSELKIPLMIAGARARSSLRLAKRLCLLLGRPLPALVLLTATEADDKPLRKIFPKARVRTIGESRWDRVKQRLEKGSPRAQELFASCAKLPKPWGVMGSVWPEDLKFWGPRLNEVPGTLWIVPHRVDPRSIDKISTILKQQGTTFEVSSAFMVGQTGAKVILVNEMGFLSELYGAASWSFVGGGFGEGVHSTIEPAIAGIPIAVGPKGTSKFTEIAELAETGQVAIVRRSEDLDRWLTELRESLAQLAKSLGPAQWPAKWKEQARQRLGATSRTLQEVMDLVQR